MEVLSMIPYSITLAAHTNNFSLSFDNGVVQLFDECHDVGVGR